MAVDVLTTPRGHERTGDDPADGACPLCSAGNVRVEFRTPAWAILSCGTCHNAWTSPPPRPPDYAADDFHKRTLDDGGAPKTLADLPPAWRRTIELQTALLAKVVPPGGRILDVGCGEGLFLEALASRGFRVTGVEPSIAASRRAEGRGQTVFTGYFPHPEAAGPFDAVNLSHVLEHIEDIDAVFAGLEAAAPGGSVLFTQSHWRGVIPWLKRDRWYAWVSDQHFWHFSPRGLATLLGRRGWETEAVAYSSLVHAGSTAALAGLARLVPPAGDQFHFLARVPGRSRSAP